MSNDETGTIERPLNAPQFLRRDAYLYLIFVSDEERDYVDRMPEPANGGKRNPQREFAFN